jgi:hypothetical protein
MGLDTKTYWLTVRQSQCDFDFDFDLIRIDTKTDWLTDRQSQCDFDFSKESWDSSEKSRRLVWDFRQPGS